MEPPNTIIISTVRLREIREPRFADTFYWIALTNRRDDAHFAAMQFRVFLALKTVVTSDEVLTEFLAYCASSV